MGRIAESIRRNSKIIVISLALGLVALYMLPLDQIFAAGNPISRVISAFENAKNRIILNTHIPGVCNPGQPCTGVKGNIINQLNIVEYRILSVLQFHGF